MVLILISAAKDAKQCGYTPILDFLIEGERIIETIEIGIGEYIALTGEDRIIVITHWYGESEYIEAPGVARQIEEIIESENTELATVFCEAIKRMLDFHSESGYLSASPVLTAKLKDKIDYVHEEIEEKKSKPKEAKPEFVYFLTADNGLTKIGRTINPDSRMHHFTTKLPYELIETVLFETDNNTVLEEFFHKHFANKRIRGEWFSLTEEDIAFVRKNIGKFDLGISISEVISSKYIQ